MPDLTSYQQFIHLTQIARFLEAEQRRETWKESVARYFDFFEGIVPAGLKHDLKHAHAAVLDMAVMPSTRALATAGPALKRDNAACYHCSYLPIDNPRCFDEVLYILACGTGVGYSVESQYVEQLPAVPERLYPTETTIVVEDSKIGWASAYRELVHLLYAGKRPQWDLRKVRAAGTRLKTFGGRASGPEPLNELFEFTVRTFEQAQGRQLNTLEVHDLMCVIGNAIVSGGVRRSAEISLSDMGDERLRSAKSGKWYESARYRAMANNSAVYNGKPDLSTFVKEWLALYQSQSGERGMFNRLAAQEKCRQIGRADDYTFGTNPCAEIILRPYQFCNLSEVCVRPDDTAKDIEEKVRIATFLGTIQATLTNFRYLRSRWRKNCEEERLLGVSFTGIMDNPLTYAPKNKDLQHWRAVAREYNEKLAKKLEINPAAAVTCVKPSGTISQLANTSSGIHPRKTEYYTRRVMLMKTDPVAQFLRDNGAVVEDSVYQSNSVVVGFPVQAPHGSIFESNLTAEQHLNLWKQYNDHWAEHSVSCTVHVQPDEWLSTANWVWQNFASVTGLSFMPAGEAHNYKQLPFEPLTEEQYKQAVAASPRIDWTAYRETDDNTTSSQEIACTGGKCEL